MILNLNLTFIKWYKKLNTFFFIFIYFLINNKNISFINTECIIFKSNGRLNMCYTFHGNK